MLESRDIMNCERLLIILSSLFYLLGGVCAILFGCARLTRMHPEKHRILGKLHGRQRHLLIATCCLLIAALGTGAAGKIVMSSPLEMARGPRGEPLLEASLRGFERELEDETAGAKDEAKQHFESGKRESGAHRYRDAATSYRKSVEALPTMSAYLNLGIALFYIGDFHGAKQAFRAGLQIAREKRAAQFRAVFRSIRLAQMEIDQRKLQRGMESHADIVGDRSDTDRPVANVPDADAASFHEQQMQGVLESYEKPRENDSDAGKPAGDASR